MAKRSTASKTSATKQIVALKHTEASRKNIPTAELESVMQVEQQSPLRVAYERRNRDLDPQLVWRGKDEQDWSDLVVQAPPLFIQEKVHPKVLVDDLKRQSDAARLAREVLERAKEGGIGIGPQIDLFADFNGLPSDDARTEFYQHDAHWSNRMILGDSLQVMASLAEREGLRGKVQCIYIDPPYGIKFNSNFQWSTTSRDVKDGNAGHITREPEQVKAFRDTWRDGIHSYLTYLRDRLTAGRDLLADSGSIFVQIGDENIHRVRELLDELFGADNCISQIGFAKTSGSTEDFLGQTTDFILWYAKDKQRVKFRLPLKTKRPGEPGGTNYNRVRTVVGDCRSLKREDLTDTRIKAGELRIYSLDNLTSQGSGRDKGEGAASWFGVQLNGRTYKPSITVRWKTNELGMSRLKLHARWWEQRIARQKEIDASIAAKAEFEYLYDKPYEDKKKVRVAGPFTVESLSPHRMLNVGADDELIDPNEAKSRGPDGADFAQMILENLRTAGVQQAHKEDRITFTSLSPWPGRYICAEGRYTDASGTERRAGIFIGPEFGTVARQDLVLAAREAGDANFDVVIACAFNYEAHASEFDKLGRIRVLKARMNAELHMADNLKNTGKGNLFVIFGEPDIEIIPDAETNGAQIRVKIRGVDVFHPQSGEVRSDGAEGIACWFIDTDYNEESFFVRQAYFLGQNDPYKALKTTLKAEINEEAWATLNSDTSRPFAKPDGGKIAVKVINHLGDEVMKVFKV